MVEYDAEILLARARAGDNEAMGTLLDSYRSYLRLVARSMIGTSLQARVDPSDLAQETLLKASRDLPGFTGTGETSLLAWLRKILAHSLINQVKHQRAQVRDHRREEGIEAWLDRGGREGHERLGLVAPISSPSSHATRRESAVILAQALDRLPADHREVLILRNLEHLSIDEVAARMGRSPNATRKLWTRAFLALKALLEGRL